MNKIRRVLFVSTLFFVGIFCFNVGYVLAADSPAVVINEIAWMGTKADANDEWIELYNNTSQEIDLSGWVLSADDGIPNIALSKVIPANGYFLLERTDDATVNSVSADLIYTGALSNSGEYLKLKNPNNEVIDEVDNHGGWSFGNNDTKQTMERTNNGWQTSALIGGTPRAKNSSSGSAPEIPKQESANNVSKQESGGGGVASGSVVINEIVSDPEDGPEWIELYNKTGGKIYLSGWRIEEGSETETMLNGAIDGYGYLVIESPKGNLNNTGDIIFLFDNFGNIIDQVSYGNWDDGNIHDNGPASGDPNGIGRIGKSQDTNNDLADWQIVSVLTPAAANILINENREEQPKESVLKNKIIINEIFPNPKGSDDGEFIELKNISGEEIDLSGLSVGDNSARRHKIRDGVKIKAGEFFVISRNESKIALNNTGGDKVVLYDVQGNVIDEVEYSEKAPEDKSYILTPQSPDERLRRSGEFEGIWEWTDAPSAGAPNILIRENQPPVAVIYLDKSDVAVGEEFSLDSSDSYDPEGKNLILEWQANGLLYHNRILKLKFNEIGNYEIKLILNDGEKKVVETRLARVGSATSSNENPISKKEIGFPNLQLINEFLPNPEGSDDAEFIELFNSDNFEINLKNFYLDDGDGGSSPYQIKDDIILKPLSYFVFERALTKLALNNTGDSVRLLDENKNVLQQVDYSDVAEGASFARAFDGNWFWTKAVTKGAENQIDFADQVDSSVGGIGLNFDEIELNRVREMELGESVKTRGVVSVLPGVLGAQVFYISGMLVGNENAKSSLAPLCERGECVKSPQPPPAKEGTTNPPPTPPQEGSLSAPPQSPSGDCGAPLNTSPREGEICVSLPDKSLSRAVRERGWGVGGIQIYSYKKDFPELNIGDEIEVFGVVSQSGGEHRLKISQKNDIKILGHKDDIAPIKITAEEIGKDLEGGFVLIEGEIVEINGLSIFIDDGSGEARVYLKESSGVKKSGLKERDVISVAGIISQTSSGFRLLPRFQDDIKKVEALEPELTDGAVKEKNADVIIEPKNGDWLKYITAGLGAVVLILVVVNFRMRKERG